MNSEQTTVRRLNSIVGIFFILFLQGCYTQFVVEEKKVASNGWQEDSATIKYVYFPQDRLVPIPGWQQVSGDAAAAVTQGITQVADEIAPQPTVPESWTVLYFPDIIQSGAPAVQWDQENEPTIFPNIVTQTRTSSTKIVTTNSPNDVRRTSGVERSVPVSSQPSAQNNSRSTGATRSGGR